jgi:precorrin-2/cobalt-factor-2 C20-methyltransferase
VEFNMEADEGEMADRYGDLAAQIGQELEQGKTVAYLTIGDAMTYSTYIYLLKALQERYPGLPHRTYPGITSYAAAASALGWPLGEGKERVLILPCPDEAEALRQDIEAHDVVVLMKIGKRLPMVLDVLREMDILHLCAFTRRIGLPGELVCADLQQLPDDAQGYLATMLIRKTERRKRTG